MWSMAEEPIDEDGHMLVVRLCSETGTMMEFASADAISIRGIHTGDLDTSLSRLIDQTKTAL